MGTIAKRIGVSAGNAFVWFTTVQNAIHRVNFSYYYALLSDGERHRHEAFHFEDDRNLYLVAHALLRTSLSRYADVEPKDWMFKCEEFSKPRVDLIGADSIQFNLSHTRGLAACVVARDSEVGIDVERIDRQVNSDAIASRYFSKLEAKQLAALSGSERDRRFVELWTLKEAYVKACGGGLSMKLDTFHFQRESTGTWKIGFDSNESNSDDWQFACLRPTPEHVMSIAIHRPNEPSYQIQIEEAIPLHASIGS